MLADAPAMGTVACELMSTMKVLPAEVPTLFGLRLSVPEPAARAVAGTSTEATRNMALADSAASLDRFTWLSLSGIGGRSRTFEAFTSALLAEKSSWIEYEPARLPAATNWLRTRGAFAVFVPPRIVPPVTGRTLAAGQPPGRGAGGLLRGAVEQLTPFPLARSMLLE